MRLRDKVIIVTGSTTGIGKAIARQCAAEGAFVVVHGLEEAWGREVVEELGKDRAVLHIEDISAVGAAERLVKVASDRFGKLDAVVNNAAIIASSNIHSTDLNLLRKVMDVNLVAPFTLIKAALPDLSKNHGCVLNIGSVNAYSGEPNLLAYSMSKGALMTMTRNLGDTLYRENRVRVNQLNPGWVLTENERLRKKEQGLPDNWYQEVPSTIAPAARLLSPAEIAAAAIYWLGDESAAISGQVVDLEQYPMIGRNPPKNT
jgi:NAD(P)-dependent dehydrogenase (short-subunit alcohol dehydrogenase family)